MNRRILILGEGATELRVPSDRWSGCGRVLLRRALGDPPEHLLSFQEHTLSNFRRDRELVDGEPRRRGEDEQARFGRKLAARVADALVLMRDDDHRGRRPAIERGFLQAQAEGHAVPAVLALAIECIEAWALADPDAWAKVFGSVPALPGALGQPVGSRVRPSQERPASSARGHRSSAER